MKLNNKFIIYKILVWVFLSVNNSVAWIFLYSQILESKVLLTGIMTTLSIILYGFIKTRSDSATNDKSKAGLVIDYICVGIISVLLAYKTYTENCLYGIVAIFSLIIIESLIVVMIVRKQ